MGSGRSSVPGRQTGGRVLKKLIRDIREAFRHADDPRQDKLKKCFLYNGDDPQGCPICDSCEVCEIKKYLEYEPEFPETGYAFFLSSYIEAFRPSPKEISWRDFEIYHVFLTARYQHEREMTHRDGG